MNKYFLGIIGSIIVIPISITLVATKSVAQSCANYWVNPQTGKQECLKITRKPSFQYLGRTRVLDESANKMVTAKFYIEKNIAVTNGLSKPAQQVTIFSNGYRYDAAIIVDCTNQAIATNLQVVSFRGKTQIRNEYQDPEFKRIAFGNNSTSEKTYNYICDRIIPRN